MAVRVALIVAHSCGEYTAVSLTPFTVRYGLRLQNRIGIEHNSARWQDQEAALSYHACVVDNTLTSLHFRIVYFQTQVPSILPSSVLCALSLITPLIYSGLVLPLLYCP
jgi:hypothetical protein